MIAHTPRPWSVDSDISSINKLPTPFLVRGRGATICEIVPQSGGIAEANAKLIAAAPELAEALKNLVGVCDRVIAKEPPDRIDRVRLDEARAALKKAGVL